jgi:hypothetical protein
MCAPHLARRADGTRAQRGALGGIRGVRAEPLLHDLVVVIPEVGGVEVGEAGILWGGRWHTTRRRRACGAAKAATAAVGAGAGVQSVGTGEAEKAIAKMLPLCSGHLFLGAGQSQTMWALRRWLSGVK